MARTIEEIFNSIVAEKNKRPELTGLNSPSASAIWRLWAHITAVAHHFVETLFDAFKIEITDIITRKEYGTPLWFVEKAKEFQEGDELAVIDGKTVYPVVDTAKQIIKRVAYKETAGGLLLKVAKQESDGAAGALSNEQVGQFSGYITKIKPAGLSVSVSSLNADKLRVTATVYYDPMYLYAEVRQGIADGMAAYMENLPFDGIVYRNQIIDALQKVPGVIDVEIDTITLVQGAETVDVLRLAETAAGYLVEDTSAGNDFESTITLTV
jgi:hypothetical protein